MCVKALNSPPSIVLISSIGSWQGARRWLFKWCPVQWRTIWMHAPHILDSTFWGSMWGNTGLSLLEKCWGGRGRPLHKHEPQQQVNTVTCTHLCPHCSLGIPGGFLLQATFSSHGLGSQACLLVSRAEADEADSCAMEQQRPQIHNQGSGHRFSKYILLFLCLKNGSLGEFKQYVTCWILKWRFLHLPCSFLSSFLSSWHSSGSPNTAEMGRLLQFCLSKVH